MANLPLDGKIGVLQEIIELQQKQIQDLQDQLDGHYEDYEHKEKPFYELKEEREAKPT
jgi:hypothetical protein